MGEGILTLQEGQKSRSRQQVRKHTDKTSDALDLSSLQDFKLANILHKILCRCHWPQPLLWAGLQTALVEDAVRGVEYLSAKTFMPFYSAVYFYSHIIDKCGRVSRSRVGQPCTGPKLFLHAHKQIYN